VILISLITGVIVAGIIEAQMATYNERRNNRLEEMENRFTHRLNQIKGQVSELQK